MPEKKEGPMQDMIDRGNLSLQVTSTIGLLPVENARISISYTGEDSVVEEITTDNSGRTEAVSLPAPPLEWSLDAEQTNRPYAELNLQITAPGYQPVTIEGSELLADATALQQVRMEPTEEMQQTEDIVIPDHTLYGEYPPKIPEEEIKPMAETGEIVLSKVVIPEYVVVHDGPPTDSRATNYYVKYKDYIKKCGVFRDLCDMAGGDDLRQYALYPVVYLKQGFYRVVQKQRVRFYDHKLNRI